MKTVLRMMALASVVLLLSPAAYAAGQAGNLREACKDDAQKFCQDVKPGGGRITNSLEDHYKEISDGCYSALKSMPSPRGGQQNGGQQGGGQQNSGPQDSNNDTPDD